MSPTAELQQAAEFVDGARPMTRDRFARSRPVEQFDALVSRGYIEPHRDGFALTTAGRWFVEDRS